MPEEKRQQDFIYENWETVRKVLQKPNGKVRALTAESKNERKTDEEVLRDYLGDEKFQVLRALSINSKDVKQKIGHVILLPGIMGSHLTVIEKSGDRDHIWLNYWRIVKGDLKRLEIDRATGKNKKGEDVEATGLLGSYYGLALEMLQADPFPYDWRLDVRQNAEKLAAAVEAKLGSAEFKDGDKLSFVAHSMGGLVVRSFIQQRPDLWERAKGKLIMLGTPNSGAFAAVKGLMGKNETAGKLALIDFFHDNSEINRIINTFYGLYQLCPSNLVNPEVYEESLWKTFPDVWFKENLMRVPTFYQTLFDARQTTINAERMLYIAGSGFETPESLKPLNGGYDFATTLDGDGTVPHKLGLLEGVTTYYTDQAAHADLPDNVEVIEAVRDILETGDTQRLKKQKPVVTRSRAAVLSVEADSDLMQAEVVAEQIRNLYQREMRRDKLSEISEETMRSVQAKANISQSVLRDAERKLVKALLGGNFDRPEKEYFDDEPDATPILSHLKDFKLKIRLEQESITKATADVIVVGQYQDLPPKGAVGSLDRHFSADKNETGWIAAAQKNGMLGAELGHLFFIPVDARHDLKVKSVIIVGMGKFHNFSRDDLRFLMMNAALGVLTLGYDSLATVLIGTSTNKLSIENAVRNILYGISDALKRMPPGAVKKLDVMISEIAPERFNAAKKVFSEIAQNFKNDDELNAFKIEFEAEDAASKAEISSFNAETIPKEDVTRLTVLRNKKSFSLSAVTSTATIPVREIPFQDFIVDSLIEKLRLPQSVRRQTRYGRLMHSIAIPEDFQSFIDTNNSLVLQLNREAAAIPWELVKYGGRRGLKNFGIDLRLTRQFISSLAPAPTVAPPLNNYFKALIIADPAGGNLQLPGARLEGEQLKSFFERLKQETAGDLTIELHTRIGADECDIVEILALINAEEFDLIHFAGHGVFEEEKKFDSTNDKNGDQEEVGARGWVFGRKDDLSLKVLSAREIFRLRRVPRLVFANACFSSVLGAPELPENLSTFQSSAKLAGIAEAFFLRGIGNYVGAGWEVNDLYAIEFAKTFYYHALAKQRTLSEALREARQEIAPRPKFTPIDSTWGAYQHYGDANAHLVDFQKPASEKSSAAKSEKEADADKTTSSNKKGEKRNSDISEKQENGGANS
jgi:hypothetical protein